MFKKLLTKGLMLSALLGSASSFAVEGGWIGFGLGASKLDWEGADTSVALSLNGGVRATPELAIGLDIQNYRYEEGTGIFKAAYTFSPFMLTGTYHFSGFGSGPYLGAMFGLAQHKIEFLGLEVSTSTMAFGGHAGYDFMLSDTWSLGPRFTYLHANKKTGEVLEVESVNFWSLLAAAAWQF